MPHCGHTILKVKQSSGIGLHVKVLLGLQLLSLHTLTSETGNCHVKSMLSPLLTFK